MGIRTRDKYCRKVSIGESLLIAGGGKSRAIMFYPVESHRTISENQKSVSVIFVKLDSDKKMLIMDTHGGN